MTTTTMRQFVTVAGNHSGARRTRYESDTKTVFVAEIVAGMGCKDVDDEGIEVAAESRDAVATLVTDLVVPLFCCRRPKLSTSRTPLEALRQTAAKGWEQLSIGQVVLLNGEEVTL